MRNSNVLKEVLKMWSDSLETGGVGDLGDKVGRICGRERRVGDQYEWTMKSLCVGKED